jgi:hypothetical protein
MPIPRVLVARYIQIAVVILLLVALVVVLAAPSLDLEPTALRAVRAAALLFFALFCAAHVLLSSFSFSALPFCTSTGVDRLSARLACAVDLQVLHTLFRC